VGRTARREDEGEGGKEVRKEEEGRRTDGRSCAVSNRVARENDDEDGERSMSMGRAEVVRVQRDRKAEVKDGRGGRREVASCEA
jgi:hypothetical protein